MGFRKPEERAQGLKMLFYGMDNTGKSVTMLTFPKINLVDTESKAGVYEGTKRGKNLIGIADTAEYYEVLALCEELVNDLNGCATFAIDSESNLNDSMKVSMMEVEERKAKKKNYSVDEAIVSMRGYGKISLNTARLKNLKAQLSALGVTVISIAHAKPVYEEIDGQNKIVGYKPDLKDTAKHDYDVILRFYTEKENNEINFYAEVEKDTTELHKIGDILQDVTYDDFKSYIDKSNSLKKISAKFDKAISENMEDSSDETSEEDDLETWKSKVDNVFKQIKDLGNDQKLKAKEVLALYGGDPRKIKDVAEMQKLHADLSKLYSELTKKENL